MTEQPTTPLPDDLVAEARWYQRPLSAVRFWEGREMPPMLGQWWRSATGPWGRFYAAIGLGLALVYRPTTWSAVVGITLVTLISTLGRYHWLGYVVPVLAVVAGIGPEVGVPLSIGLLIFGHRLAQRASRPDALAERLHLRIAELTGSPTKEEFWRYETFSEAHDRIGAYPPIRKARSKAGNPLRRIRHKDHRPLNPVPRYLRIHRASLAAVAEGAYPITGLWVHYPASCPDDNPDWQQRLLDAVAAKLPPMAIPGTTETVAPGLIGAWQTAHDYVEVTVARPMPARVELADLPESPWEDTVSMGLTSPDYPVATMIDGVATVVWNLFNDYDRTCPVAPNPNGIFIGPPGGGKTNAGRTAIHQVREYLRAEVWAIDGKEEGAFAYLSGQEGCRETADPVQAKAIILDAHDEMRARYAANDRARRNDEPLYHWRPILIPIDEGMSWLDQIANDPDLEGPNGLLWKLVDLARKGRGARIALLWMTQRADVKGVAGAGTVGQMRDSLGFKLVGPGTSETGGRMVFGDSSGALTQRIPKQPLGRMGVMVGQNPDHFGIAQIASTPDPLAKTTDADGFRRYADRARPPEPPPPDPSSGNRLRVVTP